MSSKTSNGELIPVAPGAVTVPQIRALIAGLDNVGEVLAIRDHAQLILHAIGDREDKIGLAQDAAEVKVWAERRVGRLLKEREKQAGARGTGSNQYRKVESHDANPPPTLAELGIKGDESSRCQAIDDLDEKVVEEKIAEARKAKEVVTSAALIKIAKADRRRKERRAAAAARAAGKKMPTSCRLTTGDVLKELRKLSDASAQLGFADPPYNVGVDYGNGSKADRLGDDDYVGWCRSWFDEMHRVLAVDGTFWLLVGWEYADRLALELRAAGFHRRAWIVWYETFGVCNSAKNNFSRSSRPLFYCVKDPKRFTFNVEAVTRASDRQTKYDDARAEPDGKVWDDVWQIPRLTGTCAERLPDFPTQLPLALVTPIIAATSNKGDTVLEPFAGSATGGVAALRLGRGYLGIEDKAHFVRAADERLKGEA